MTFTLETKKNLKSDYTNNLVSGFYYPLLSEANLYQRVSGYFSTAGLDLYAEGIEELAKNGGEAQFVVSKEISSDDFSKIKTGYELFNSLKSLNLAERNERLSTTTQQQLGNLAYMIAAGRARVKVALTKEGSFHDKFGIITSGSERVFFTGSANETQNGISKNYESISVDVSWDTSDNVTSRIQSNADRFSRLWNNQEPNVRVIEASDLAYEEIAKYQSQSNIKEIVAAVDLIEQADTAESISFHLFGNSILRQDNTPEKLTLKDRKLRPGSDISNFFELDNATVKSTSTYKDIQRIIKVTTDRAARKNISVTVSPAVLEFISRNKYSIEQYKILGEVYKGSLDEFPENKIATFAQFSSIVQQEVQRPLYELHLRAAYYEYEMARAANFSVPGAGKTAMILGVFAYLNRDNTPHNEKIDRILVISPINAFDSWKREFFAVFKQKKPLSCFDSQSSRDFTFDLSTKWSTSNLILVNYESLPTYVNQIKSLVNDRTMLVFDEVHRIKNPNGIRAKKALEISQLSKFKYVLTGTPIPNTYRDIYNFLHILYGDEYNAFFGWDEHALLNPKIREIEEINKRIHPFFWRTNKDDLQVPPADSDIIKLVPPTDFQLDLAEAIYHNESTSFAKLIRLIQASTNPDLVNKAINYNELMSFDDDGDTKGISEKDFNDLLYGGSKIHTDDCYSGFDFTSVNSPKFDTGIELVVSLVESGKKVLVWGIFVDTIKKIATTLRKKGVKVNLVYGGTDKSERVSLIDDFRDGDIQVLVSNPQTLGESISLHEKVHDAVYFEYDFNLTFMLQSRDRIHRLGLKRNQYTRYHYLQTKAEEYFSERPGYIDEKIYTRLKEKEQIMYGAIDDDSLFIEYTVDEIQEAIKIIDEERERINRQQ